MRLIIVSNRLPIVLENGKPRPRVHRSIGGLATGIESFVKQIAEGKTIFNDYIWIGWPGISVAKTRQEELTNELVNGHRLYPVFLSKKIIDDFYLGFCNKTIWPLFHYFPNHVMHDIRMWKSYQKANECFLAVIRTQIQPRDLIWIHDYHLMLLPQLIRQEFPAQPISFFLHIPFPSYDSFRNLGRTEQVGILNGLLQSDLVAFHTADYADNFLKCAAASLGASTNHQSVLHKERNVQVGIFPMGIDYAGISALAATKSCQAASAAIRKDFAERKIILSIDRLDYTKGIINRLEAYEEFLRRSPQWIGKVIMMLVVAPSRRELSAYRQIKRNIDEAVGRINGSFGTNNWVPVNYQYQQIDLPSLCALYAAADIAMVTPLRDGLNLIAKEFICSHTDRLGVLILSETAGAINELQEVIVVNPFNKEELIGALSKALSMTPDEQVARNIYMHDRLKKHDVIHWASEIMNCTLQSHNSASFHLQDLP